MKMKKVRISIFLSILSFLLALNSPSVAANGDKHAQEAVSGDLIRYFERTRHVTEFIYKYCELQTVVIVPSNWDGKMQVGVVCKKRQGLQAQ